MKRQRLRDHVVIAAAMCTGAARGQLFDNGPLITPSGAGAACLPAWGSPSEVPGSNTIAGWNASAVLIEGGFRVADDFEVPSGTAWHVQRIRLPMYQIAVTTASVNDVRFRIWRGRPDDPGSVVVFGDLETNRLVSNSLSPVFRYFYTQCATLRRIQTVRATANVTLPPGTYWIEWNAAGTSWSGPWAPAVTIQGAPGKPGANGRHRISDGWTDAMDGGVPQDFTFVLEGAAACYPDCNSDGALNTPDFACFQTRFTQSDPYADCTGDGVHSIGDFACFQLRFVLGCP